MSTNNNSHTGTVLGTVSGTTLSVLGINSAEIVKTAVLAATGVFVSFTVSVILKWLSKKLKK